jgi:Ser/Thr protein kinase RdoA (MazF antagonist)
MKPTRDDHQLQGILRWCASIVGAFEIVSEDRRFHGRTSVYRLETPALRCYLKIHRELATWESEVFAYRQWAQAFGKLAPQLLAVYEVEPRALLVEALPGQIMEKVQLPGRQEEMAWRAAGRALAGLHGFTKGDYFGACRCDGAFAQAGTGEATVYVAAELERLAAQGVRADYLSREELAIVRTAQGLVPAFAGERPVPCHRDYCPANWLVTNEGDLVGVIDFEFAQWDVRVADFSRYPDWEWIRRPNLLEAFFEGYGLSLTPKVEQQRLVAHTQYALAAIVWGCEHSYHGFAEEGHQALRQLAKLLG